MVDVTPTSPVGVVLPADQRVSETTRDRQQRKRKDRQHQDEFGDAAVMVGIPEEELTPNVQNALTALLRELEEKREDLAHAQAHTAYLENLADSHPYLPVINRRALLREVSRIQAHAKQVGTTNAFVYLHIPAVERIRIKYGHVAAQGAMIQAAAALSGALRASDVIGSLGDNNLGVVLTLADDTTAANKVPVLVAAIEDQPFTWRNETIKLAVAAGMHVFEAEETADAGVDAADRDLIGGGSSWRAS